MSLLGQIAESVFPPRCVFCGAILPRGEHACASCLAAAPRTEGLFVPQGRPHRAFAFSACAVPFYYDGPVKTGIRRLKFHGHPSAARGFASLCLPALQTLQKKSAFDLVTAVPLSRREMRSRGYNQAALFGQAVSGLLAIPYEETLAKPCDIKPQHDCGGAERWGNVFGAFTVCKDIKERRVLLADDVITTGATLNECAKMLRLAGASEVCGAAIARAR